MLYFKRMKFLQSLIIVLGFLVFQKSAIAGGIPYFQYNLTNAGLVNPQVLVDSSNRDWTDGTYHYKVISTVNLSNGYKYGYSSTMNVSGYVSAGLGTVELYMEIFDGTSWIYYSSLCSSASNYNKNFTLPSGLYSSLRFVCKTTYRHYPSIQATSIPVYLVAADQDTVESANTAAQGAKASADAAKVSSDQAKTSADIGASRAQTTINQTWYTGTYGGHQESVSNIAGYIRMSK